MFGVSPAYFLSLFSPDFTIPDVCAGLANIAGSGFTYIELETFTSDQLSRWTDSDTGALSARIAELDLQVSQFVAHHLMRYFTRPSLFHKPLLFSDFERLVHIASQFESCRIVTIPQPEFHADTNLRPDTYRKIRESFLSSLSRLRDIAAGASLTLALEIMPGSLIGSSDGFLTVSEAIGSPRLAYNFDTGHAWACKEAVELIPLKLGRYIAGTHLSDNFGQENLSLAPGKGSIPWAGVFSSLQAAGYSGPFDIEIRCGAEAVQSEYSSALQFLNKIFHEVLEVNNAAKS